MFKELLFLGFVLIAVPVVAVFFVIAGNRIWDWWKYGMDPFK